MTKENISYCGLYCSECGRYKKGKCPGCGENVKATWCKTRKCCIENSISSCADCKKHENQKNCTTFNNFIGKSIEFFSGTSRFKNLKMIQEKGYSNFANHMTSVKLMSLKKKEKT